MDYFSEYIIKQKKSKKVFLAATGMIILTLAVWILTFPFVVHPMLSSIVGLIDAAAVYASYLVISNFNIEYEYCVTNSEMDVDKIINRKKRKRVTSVKFTSMELMAPCGDPRFANEENGNFAKIHMAAKSENDPDAYFIIYEENGQRTKLVFNPIQKMIDTAKFFAPRKTYER